MEARNKPAAPSWHYLTPEIQLHVLALLTQMLQEHLPAPNANAEREVANESR
jgi:hypothetical protein